MNHCHDHNHSCGITAVAERFWPTWAWASPAWRWRRCCIATAIGSERPWSPPNGQPHFAPKAKSVIWLFMNGGVSHMESFDPKPMLNKYAGKTIAETPFADAQDPKKLAIERLVVPDANGNQRNDALSAAGRLSEAWRKRHRGQRLVSAHRPQRGSTGRRPLDVDDRQQPRRADAVPFRPAHDRRRVPDARRLGALRARLAQRQPAAVHLDRHARILEQAGRPLPGPGARRRAAAHRSRRTRSTSASPSGHSPPRRRPSASI